MRFLNEAVRIGEQLLAEADGDSWTTIKLEGDSIAWRTDETLYGGVTGIALFFLELAHATGDARYRTAAERALRGVIAHSDRTPPASAAFYTGRLGVCYALLRFDVEAALRLARPCVPLLEDKRRIDDLLSGTAGSMLALAHLYAASSAAWLLDAIAVCASRLIARAQLGKRGVYWDRSEQNVGGLCGFSHGAAGIGFALRETARLLGSEGLRWLAGEAFAYEATRFDAARENWPDLRSAFYGPEDPRVRREAYRRGQHALFTTGYDMNAWCHGAVGVGFSRLRAIELGEEQWQADAAVAVRRAAGATVEKAMRAPTLCHGVAGNLVLLAQAGKREEAAAAGDVLLAARALHGAYASGYAKAPHLEDRSLFMGNAGIGYAFLQLSDGPARDRLLAPAIDAEPMPLSADAPPVLTMTAAALRRHFLERHYPRSFTGTVAATPLPEHGSLDDDRQWLARTVEGDAGRDELHTLERLRFELDTADSLALLAVEREVAQETAEQFAADAESLRTSRLHVNPRLRLHGGFVLAPTAMGVVEATLHPLVATLLEECDGTASAEEVVRAVAARFDGDVEEVVRLQLLELVRAAMLLRVA